MLACKKFTIETLDDGICNKMESLTDEKKNILFTLRIENLNSPKLLWCVIV